MSNVAKLKKQAAELELKKQFDKALAIYIKLLASFDENASELDVALFNRVGDLLLRQGNVADAVDYYEQAVDRYGETGFFNNAIALCNKILRHSPGRASVYYKLGKISAQKGFKNDAKVNFLEYADRMQKGGKVDEAFRALKEFADLCPDQDEIRLMLAEQLTKADRKSEAIEQLQTLHERYDSEGRASEAAATASRMRSIDPSVEPRSAGGGRRKTTSGDLIFIDLDSPSLSGSYVRQRTPPSVPEVIRRAPEPELEADLDEPLDSELDPVLATVFDPVMDAEPDIDAAVDDEPVVEIPLMNTDIVIGTPMSTPVVDDPLGDVMSADESLGLLKSTPTSSLFVIDPIISDEEQQRGFDATPMSSGIIEEAFVEAPAVIPTPVASDILIEEPTIALTPVASDIVVEEPTIALTPVASDVVVEESTIALTPVAPDVVADELSIVLTPMWSEAIIDEPAVPSTPQSTAAVEELFDAPMTPMSSEVLSEDFELADVFGEGETVEEADAVDEVAPDESVAIGDDLEFVMPDDEPVAAAEAPSIDFDLASLTTPPIQSTPASLHAPLRPTPNTTRVALDGLPLMDLELPDATPHATPLVPSPRERVPMTAELELIEDPGVGMMSDLMDRVSADADASVVDLNEESLTVDEDDPTIPTPSVASRSTRVAERSVEILRDSVRADPDNWSLRRQLAEVMLEAGHRDDGIRELEAAMNGSERFGDLDLASSLAEEIARLEPGVVRHHQKRVEYAFRTNDRSRLIEAYVSLADALLASDQSDKARTVYQRVLDLAPDDARARAGIDTLSVGDTNPFSQTPVNQPSAQRRSSVAAAPPDPKLTPSSASFVNLGDWLRDDAVPRDTRMVVEEHEPTGDEAADFADMLRKFKQGVAENVDPEDYQSHYDLAIAFKEMGLLDEAIAEFQKALGSPTNRLPTYEALGQCFLEKSQYKLASSILSRALTERAPEEQLVGVLYLLGRSAEAQGLATDAVTYYQRVFVIDIQFRDTADRLSELERVAR